MKMMFNAFQLKLQEHYSRVYCTIKTMLKVPRVKELLAYELSPFEIIFFNLRSEGP